MDSNSEKFILEMIRDIKAGQVYLANKFDDVTAELDRRNVRISALEASEKAVAKRWSTATMAVVSVIISAITLGLKSVLIWLK